MFLSRKQDERKTEACAEVIGRSHTYNVSSEVNGGEFLVDVFDGGLHALICQEGKPRLWVCTGL